MDNEIAIIDDVNSMTNVTEPIKVTGLGTRLKTAREAMHLSQKEAADRLYLSVKIISLIENENFSDGPPTTFLRGYLRSYAKLLNVPESEIKAELDEIDLAIPIVNIKSPILHATPINRSEKYIRWITYLIILTLLTLVCIWWSSQSHYLIADVPVKTTPFQAQQITTSKAAPPAKTAQTTIIKPESNHKPKPAMGIMIPTTNMNASSTESVATINTTDQSAISIDGNGRQREPMKQTKTQLQGALSESE